MATYIFDPTMSRPTSNVSPRIGVRSRTQSISSDRPSTVAQSLMSMPLSVSPPAAFIARSAASQIVTNDHDSHADTWYDQHGIEPASESALVSQEALQLVNSFLDQLLYNFLSISRATTLTALRPAVSEILKPKLAKDAINNADEELREYLGEGEEDDQAQSQGDDKVRDWDLELVWKRTRLRCMVYSSLGDMEEEDEDLYMEQENLELGADEQGSEAISPAVAIFLTSVLEYMGELTLTVAGQAAYHRLRVKFQKETKEGAKSPTDTADRIIVEDQDMERVALDRTLGRLWRGWKKRIRSPAIDLHRGSSSRASGAHLRHDSNMTDSPALSRVATYSDVEPEAQNDGQRLAADKIQPSDIALPIGSNDVDEIEVPGLALYSDDDDDDDNDDDQDEEEAAEGASGRRPKSLLILPLGAHNGLPTPTLSQPNTPDFVGRKRSNSLPTPGASPYRSVSNRLQDVSLAEKSAEKSAVDDDDEVFEDTRETQQGDDVPQVDKVDPISEQVTTSKRLSRIITNAPIAPPRKQTRQENSTNGEPLYEKAEIMTSSRVSVAGSASPALSETGGSFPIKRSSSVHSARLIDVAGPKSPTTSRSPSADTADRIHRASLTIPTNLGISNRLSTDDSQELKTTGDSSRSATFPKSRSPVDAIQGSTSNAATISESEEEVDQDTRREQRAPKYTAYQPSPLTPTVPERDSTERRRPQQIFGSPLQQHQPSFPISTSSSRSNVHRQNTTESVPEEPTEIPQRAPGHTSRHASRSDKIPTSPTHSIGMVSVERSKTRDSDEDLGSLAHSASNPRAIHTSGSSASSATSRLKAVRTSEDNSSSRHENVARNFEELIQSNQTITYTLTPETMRNIDVGWIRSVWNSIANLNSQRTLSIALQSLRDLAGLKRL